MAREGRSGVALCESMFYWLTNSINVEKLRSIPLVRVHPGFQSWLRFPDTNADTETQTQTPTHAYTETQTQIRTHAHAQTHKNTETQTKAVRGLFARAHTRTRTQAHARKHTHTHTHTHTMTGCTIAEGSLFAITQACASRTRRTPQR